MAEEGQFRLEHEPYYRPLHGEVELFEAAWRNRVPVLLKAMTVTKVDFMSLMNV